MHNHLIKLFTNANKLSDVMKAAVGCEAREHHNISF
jgi:hypothetical protein